MIFPLTSSSCLKKSSPPAHVSRAEGFSLIEVLVVVAIIGLLAAFALPAFNSIGQAKGATEAAYQIAAAVELARSEAVSRQTFVWVGFQPQTNSGNLDLRIGVVFSRDGSSTNTTAANIQPLGRAFLIERVGLTNASVLDLGTNLSGATNLADSAVGTLIGQIAYFVFWVCTSLPRPPAEVGDERWPRR